MDNQSISSIFNITDKNEIKIISTLIEFIEYISKNEQEKNNIDIDENNNNINNLNNNINPINNKENIQKNNLAYKDDNYEKRKSNNLINYFDQE